MVSVIISGMPAVGKTTVAKVLARKFGLRYYCGGDALKEIAKDRGYNPEGEDWWDTPNGMKFLNERKVDYGLDKDIDARLVGAVNGGGVVITSYPLPWLTEDGLKIWLAASVEKRAERLVTRDKVDLESAKRVIAQRDVENQRLYKDMYNVEYGSDLSVFDFVINTEHLESTSVIAISCEIVKHFL